MISQITFLFALTAVVCGDYNPYYPQDSYEDIDYNFKYKVNDDYTYNYQSRDEYKDGKTVYGSYSLVEPDGSLRIVKYTADEYGFHATVDNDKSYGQEYKPTYHKPEYKPEYKPSYYKPSYKPAYVPHGYQSAYPVHSYNPAY